MKKTLTLLLAVLLTLMMSFTVMADEETAEDEMDELSYVGINMDMTDLIENAKGLVVPDPVGAIDDEHHFYVMPVYYIGMPKEEVNAVLYDNDASQEKKNEIREMKSSVNVLIVSDLDYDATVAGISEFLGTDYSEQFANAEVIGTVDDFTFYALKEKYEDALSQYEPEFVEEFEKLQQDVLDLEKAAKLFVPVDPDKEMAGQKIEFTTTDLDGNTVTSKELFSANEITMINCWGVWCGNCMREMAELKEIHDRMQEKGCGIVGLEFEGETWDDEIKQASKAVFEENGITYPNVIIPQDLAEQLRGFPTTFFVDKEGTILCMPIVGADVESYERILDSLLEGETVMDVTTSTAEEMAETQTAVYNVRVSDENGPVKDVIIQFCSSASCSMGQTDENGVASFSMPAGEVYDIHVLQAPDAYEKDTETYHTTDESSDVEIQLKKK